MNKAALMKNIVNLVAERTGAEPGEIHANTRFEDAGIDSLDTVDLLMSLEDAIDMKIDLDEKVETIDELATAILQQK